MGEWAGPSPDRPGLSPFSACNIEKSREWPGDEATRNHHIVELGA
jgi:hypothetical protein